MPTDDEAGFTLIEVLVALVIAALLTAILLNGASSARARLAHASDERKAVFLVRTLLTRASVATLGASDREGTTNGYHWTLDEHVILPDPRGLNALVELTAGVDRNGVALFSATTRRLKSVPRG